MELKVIAKINNGFPTKFGIPRQSGLAEGVVSTIVFEPEYRNSDALRGLEEFSHIWLIWGFSAAEREEWSPTVRPPRLGGNVRKGVFSTRSPFRPNSLGLSAVRLLGIEQTSDGAVLRVSGADLMDGSPIYDIKPYLLSDCRADARDGFAGSARDYVLDVVFPDDLKLGLDEYTASVITELLRQDPRPAYQHDEDRVYGFVYDGLEIKFKVSGTALTVVSLDKINT